MGQKDIHFRKNASLLPGLPRRTLTIHLVGRYNPLFLLAADLIRVHTYENS